MVMLTANNTWEQSGRLVSKLYRNQEKRLGFIAKCEELALSINAKDPIVDHVYQVRRQFMAVGCAYSTHDMTHEIYVSTLRIMELVASDPTHYKSFFDHYCQLF